ncbi:hypothetical protein ACIOHC_36300 [Streptomyces sp. NPDC088252]|uniref:hypothetical protein n=1 Tax=Streptomyces sp. NPDC088252 TaxID=3365845 RepID=UPI003826FFE5
MTYTADQWREALEEASGHSFDDVDVAENVGPIGTALVHAWDKFGHDEEAVTAAIEAGSKELDSWDVDWFTKLVEGGVVRYDDFDEAFQNYLDDHYDGIQVRWLNDEGRKALEDGVTRESEIWVEEDSLSGIYVFNKPR